MNIGKLTKRLEEYRLDDYLDILLSENPSNNRPYHNLYHILCVVDFCYKIGRNCGLTKYELRTLMLAAIFHDFGYYSKIDAENIKRAIEFFNIYSHESQHTNDKVIKIIQATQYPYIISDNELNLSQKVIRDSDLLQWTKKNFIEQVILGLSKEMEIPIDKFIEGQTKFMLGLKFYTEMGQEIYDENIDKKIKEVEEYKKNKNIL